MSFNFTHEYIQGKRRIPSSVEIIILTDTWKILFSKVESKFVSNNLPFVLLVYWILEVKVILPQVASLWKSELNRIYFVRKSEPDMEKSRMFTNWKQLPSEIWNKRKVNPHIPFILYISDFNQSLKWNSCFFSRLQTRIGGKWKFRYFFLLIWSWDKF